MDVTESNIVDGSKRSVKVGIFSAILSSFFFLTAANAIAQTPTVEKIDPPSWWVDSPINRSRPCFGANMTGAHVKLANRHNKYKLKTRSNALHLRRVVLRENVQPENTRCENRSRRICKMRSRFLRRSRVSAIIRAFCSDDCLLRLTNGVRTASGKQRPVKIKSMYIDKRPPLSCGTFRGS